MADSQKISELTAYTTPLAADLIPVVDTANTTTKKVTWTNFVAALAAFLKTLTNTTFDTAGSGNVFKINGTTISDKTGTGKAVLDTAPQISTIELGAASDTTISRSAAGIIAVENKDIVDVSTAQSLSNKTFVAPALGTPASGVATNLTGTADGLTSGVTKALKSATTTIDVSAATAPSSGKVLTATSSTAATWQTPVGGALFSTTQVYNAAAPGSYTDLDLSSVVGATQRMVLLVITNSTASGAASYFVQRKGTSYSFDTSTVNPIGVQNARIGLNLAGSVIVATNSTGVIQWYSSLTAGTTQVNVEAYW